jgi:transcriptional regulator with XRE-family HTH domain
MESPASALVAFAGLDQAISRLVLRDSRSRKEIAEAAGINASMFSGYCSGRKIPSVEHLDRILTTLGAGIEELTYELRAVDYRVQSAPLVLWPRFLGSQEGAAAAAVLTTLLEQVRELLLAQPGVPAPAPGQPAGRGGKPERPPEVPPAALPDPRQPRAARRRARHGE